MEKPLSMEAADPYVISIIELDFHFDCLDSLIKIFENSVIKIHVFTTTQNIALLSEIPYPANVVFHEYKPFSKFLFLLKNRKTLKASDVIFINTIATNFGAYLAVPDPEKTILRIHNINKQFIPFQSVKYPKGAKATWKFTSYIGREVILKLFPFFRKWINARVGYFTFPDNGLMDYALLKGYISKDRTIESIPFKVFAGNSNSIIMQDELVITIIGATDPARRDYREIISALKTIYETQSPKIKVVLLGKIKGIYGDFVLKELQSIQSNNFTLQYFNKNVPEQEFIEWVNSSHLIISPIVAETKTDIFREVYGLTKTSGSILDFIKFGVVTMVPSFYKAPKEMEVFFEKYDNGDDLVQKILYFYENPNKLNELNYKSKVFVKENYNRQKIYSDCMHSLKSILNKNDH